MTKEVASIQILDMGPPVHEIFELTVVDEEQPAHMWPKRKFMVLHEEPTDETGHKKVDALELGDRTTRGVGVVVIDIYVDEEQDKAKFYISE